MDAASTSATPITSDGIPVVNQNTRRRYPATTHLAVVAAFILPVTLAPYLLARRRMSGLQRQVNELETLTKALQRDLHVATAANNAALVDRRRMKGMLQEVMGTTEALQVQAQEKDNSREKSDKATQSVLQHLLEETRVVRSHGDALRSLGMSLADIAAFMHEAELSMPPYEHKSGDKPRVEQLRMHALLLQNVPRQQPLPTSKNYRSISDWHYHGNAAV